MTELTVDMEKQENARTEVVERTRPGKTYIPSVDIYETKEGVILLADMPGVHEAAVDITLENNLLTLRGMVDYHEPDGYEEAYTEYIVGDYERTFTLSDEVDRSKIEATLKNGVLRLVLPKAEEAKARKITVRVES